MKESFSSYINLLDSWMKYFGFEVFGGFSEVSIGFNFDRMYHKKATEITRFGNVDTYAIVKAIEDNITAETFKSFSEQAFDYASKIRKGGPLGLGSMLVVFPLVVLEKIPQDVYTFLKSYCPKHWASVEFPCILDLETSNLYYYEQTPMWGALYYPTHRKEAYRFFSPNSWQSISEASNK